MNAVVPERWRSLRADEFATETIPQALALLEQLRVELWARLMRPREPDERQEQPPGSSEPDRLLTAQEVAQRLGVTVDWVYRHGNRFPFTWRLSRRALRFSEAGLGRWMAAKKL